MYLQREENIVFIWNLILFIRVLNLFLLLLLFYPMNNAVNGSKWTGSCNFIHGILINYLLAI